MARGEKIALNDIMPRHLRNAAEVPASVTIQVGSSVSDARRQLVLRTFASTGGDATRTAKLLGVSPDDVRGDMMALLGSAEEEAGSEESDEEMNGRGPRAGELPPRPGTAAKKAPAKKR